MSLDELEEAVARSDFDVLSTDVFDTLLLRDHSTETSRIAAACRLAAPRLGVDAGALTRLRWSFHDTAYRAVAVERPTGDVGLDRISYSLATALGLGPEAAGVLRDAEIAVDIDRLRPHRALLAILDRAARDRRRVIAVSDTPYSGEDLARILEAVVGRGHAISTIYSSADLGLTKHGGELFGEVARAEGRRGDRFLHAGDNEHSDVRRAVAASWHAVHVPRGPRFHLSRAMGRVSTLPSFLGRMR